MISPDILLRNWRVVAAVVALAAAGLWLVLHDRAVIARHEAKVEANAAPARDAAAAERVRDAAANTKSEQELSHAIDNAPRGGDLSPAAHALACERLRAIGRFPAGCRSASGNGGQAGAQ